MKRSAILRPAAITLLTLLASGMMTTVQAQQSRTGGEQAARSRAQQVSPERLASLFDITTLDADIRFLSHDLLEGRAPSGRGEAIAVEYIEARLRMAGARGPFDGGSYRQAVSLIKQRASSNMELADP